MEGFLLIAMAFAAYFAPTITASLRGHTNVNSIIALNFFLGWTFIGWVVALVWALSAQNRPPATPEPAIPERPIRPAAVRVEIPPTIERTPPPVTEPLKATPAPQVQSWVEKAKAEIEEDRRKKSNDEARPL